MNATTAQRKQMIFRFDESVISKLKYYAQREEKSLNSYVESVLKSDIEHKERLPKLVISKNLSQNIRKISGVLAVKVIEKDMENDERLAYLLRK